MLRTCDGDLVHVCTVSYQVDRNFKSSCKILLRSWNQQVVNTHSLSLMWRIGIFCKKKLLWWIWHLRQSLRPFWLWSMTPSLMVYLSIIYYFGPPFNIMLVCLFAFSFIYLILSCVVCSFVWTCLGPISLRRSLLELFLLHVIPYFTEVWQKKQHHWMADTEN